MAAPLEKTKTPGIYKRGSRYVFSYRVDGKQRWESCRTLEEARRAKAARQTDIGRGEFEERSKVRCTTTRPNGSSATRAPAGAGSARRRAASTAGCSTSTRCVLPGRELLRDLTPSAVADLIGWLVKQPNGRGGTLIDKTVRNALGPLRACLATAKREGKIAANPAAGAALPHRPRIEEDEELPRPFPQVDGVETMELVVGARSSRSPADVRAARRDRPAALGAARARGSPPARSTAPSHCEGAPADALAEGEGPVIGPLKSRHARRDLPIPLELADKLAARMSQAARTTRSCSRAFGADPTTRTTSRCGCSCRRARRPASSGRASTRSATRSPRACSLPAATPCRSSTGSGTTPQLHARHVRPPARRGPRRPPDRRRVRTKCKHAPHHSTPLTRGVRRPISRVSRDIHAAATAATREPGSNPGSGTAPRSSRLKSIWRTLLGARPFVMACR